MSRRLSRRAPRPFLQRVPSLANFGFTPETVNEHLAMVLRQVRRRQLPAGRGVRFGLVNVPGEILDGRKRDLWFVYANIEGPQGPEEIVTLQVPPSRDVFASFRPDGDHWLHVGTGRLEPGQSAEDYFESYARRVMDAQAKARDEKPQGRAGADA